MNGIEFRILDGVDGDERSCRFDDEREAFASAARLSAGDLWVNGEPREYVIEFNHADAGWSRYAAVTVRY